MSRPVPRLLALACTVLAWALGLAVSASASLPLFLTRDEGALSLLDALTAHGLLPVDAATVRHHDREWLHGWLEAVLRRGGRLTSIEEERVRELVGFLEYDTATARIDVEEPEAKAVFTLHSEIDTRQRLNDPSNATRWSMAGSFFGETGRFGFYTSAKWGVVHNHEEYETDPDDFLYGGRSFSFLPDQIWTEPAGYVSIGTPHIAAQLGRMDVAWGPGRNGSLFLSDNTDSKSGARFSALWGPLRFESLTASLPHLEQETYLSAHRLTVRAGDSVAVSVYEGVVHKDRLELAYLNPTTVYLLSIQGVERDARRKTDNLLLGGDFVWRVRPGTLVYADALLDDAQPQEGGSAFRNWDTKFAVQLGVHAVQPFGLEDTTVRAEYAFANQYAYTHEVDGINHTLSGRPLGLFLGPDADGLWLDAAKWLTRHARLGLAFRLTRKGEQTIDTPYQEGDPIEWEFLSGVEEIHREIEASWMWTRVGRSALHLRAYVDPVGDVDHQAGESELRWGLGLRARLFL